MPTSPLGLKRLLLGKPFANDRLVRERLPKRIAFPAFAADTLSSLAYAPDELLITLAVAGASTYLLSPWVGLAVTFVLFITIVTHRSIIREYPSGGGDFTVAQKNLGPTSGRVVGASLLVDYVLTVAVSTSQAAAYLSGASHVLQGYEAVVACAVIAVMTVFALRGAKDSARLSSLPVYAFMGCVGLILIVGALEAATGHLGAAPSATIRLDVLEGSEATTALGGVLLVVRAFTSGCAAVTGVKAFTNGVPNFKRPQSDNARLTLMVAGVVSGVMLLGTMLLAVATKVTVVPPARVRNGEVAVTHTQGDVLQIPVLGQISQAVFGEHSFMYYLTTVATALILLVAANTAFTGFPILASVLARHAHLPRFFAARGDRLAFSNGVLALALASVAVVWLSGASVSILINMYVVGVFISYGMGQLGLIRFYGAKLRLSTRLADRKVLHRRRATMLLGAATTSLVLLGIIFTKLFDGAWLTLAAVGALWVAMTGVARHYRQVRRDLSLRAGDVAMEQQRAQAAAPFPPAKGALSHALVLVSQLDRPTVRAILVAQRQAHTTVQAVSVKTNDEAHERLQDMWHEYQIPVPLRVVYSPYRELLWPFIDYVRSLTRTHPKDAIVVYIPEYLVGHWWEQLLHNHVLRRARLRLMDLKCVEVRAVAWKLEEDARGNTTRHLPAPRHKGDLDDQRRSSERAAIDR